MRKVKLLALLLAALMVVTAFAGCATDTSEIEGEVDGLESRVEALESAIGGVKDGVSDLESSVSGVGSALGEVNTTIQGLAGLVSELQSEIADLKETDTEAPVTQPPVVGDDEAALKAKATDLGSKIGKLQAELQAEQDNYLPDEYIAALQAMTAAQTAIANSKTVAGMDALYAGLLDELKGFVRVDTKFYNYYVELKGNYTGDDACLAKVEEALAWFETLVDHYELKSATKFEYETGETNKKGEPVKKDLFKLKEEIDGWDEELENIKAEAATLVEEIDDLAIDASYSVVYAKIVEVNEWAKKAVALAPVHEALVTNADKLDAALAASQVYLNAKNALDTVKVTSVFDGTKVKLFDDYNALVAYDGQLIFVLVDNAGAPVLDEDDDYIYVSEVYGAINEAIDEWMEEFSLDETTAEHIINAVFGANKYFYATYKNAEAFADAMKAEYDAFKAGIVTKITALNTKSLSNSMELVTLYQENADAINAWYDASVKAYKEACAAEDDADRYAKLSRAVAAEKYEEIFAKNFNEMVVLAGLGKKVTNPDKTVDFFFGAVKNDYTLGFVAAADVANANWNYNQFYSFKDDAALTFVKETYGDAKQVADKINKAVAQFPVLQQFNVTEILTAFGGYHKATVDAGVNVLEVVENVTVSGDIDTIAEYMVVYGKKGTAYAGNDKLDLSGLIDMEKYNEVVAAVFARVDEIDDATAKLNAAYDKFLGTFNEAIVTTANTAAVAELVAAVNAWKNAGGRSDAYLVKEVKTVGDYKEYELVKMIENYGALKANTDFEQVIQKIQNRSAAIVKEMNMLVSLYQMLDKVNAYSTITLDTLSSTSTSTIKKTNIAATGVEQRAANSDGKYDYNANYITFDKNSYKFKVATEYKIYGVEDKQVASEAEKKAATKIFAKLYTGDASVNKTLAKMAEDWNGKSFKITTLIEIATNLYDKFMVDNYGVKVDAVESARANFVAANNGYELKGWVVSAINTVEADVGHDYDVTSLKNVTTLAGLTTTLNASTQIFNGKITSDIAFGGYKNADLTADFALKSGSLTAAEIYTKLNIADATEYDVDAYVVWKAPSVIA